ncbi:MAG: PEP/pyruvate-binding domain-containing protein [Gemmatimonadales bacterium]|nr:PEP/pyruvate-binding domain-containing protein [Gemmatimonadales bacterium]
MPPESPDNRSDNRPYLDQILQDWPDLKERIIRALLVSLHSREIASLDFIHNEARRLVRGDGPLEIEPADDNAQITTRWDEREKAAIQELVLDLAAGAFSQLEIDDMVNVIRKRVEARSLEEVANLASVSFGLLAEKVKNFCHLPKGQTSLTTRESISTRVALIKRFISDQLEFIGVAKHYLHIRDFEDLLDHIIGSDDGTGLIGGKAGGVFLGSQILIKKELEAKKPSPVPIYTPDSYYLRSDVMVDFLQHCGLQELHDQKYKDLEKVRKDYSMIQRLLKNADFPPSLALRLKSMLESLGTHPLVVRSSSLLEDRFGTAFAGKYRSVFVCNQGSLEERLAEVIGAIAEVYSSVFHPDPISYRIRHNLLDYSENMGVLIQKVVGRQVGHYFFPTWAGVGFSENPYRRNPRIKTEDGMARIVFGLGTRAVDRVGTDYPRMIPLGLPALRPEVKTRDIVRVSQRNVDVIDLKKGGFAHLPVAEVLSEATLLPGLSHVFSALEHDFLRPLAGDRLLADPENLIVTFDQFAKTSPFPEFLRQCLNTLSETYGYPVDIEYACDGERFYLLQCRPQAVRPKSDPAPPPVNIPTQDQVFSSCRDILSGSVHDIEFLVLVDPRDYNLLSNNQERRDIALIVHRLNQRLEGKKFILLGPGRWGSKDPRLGVQVGYADINNTAMLIEIARMQTGFLPDVSFGSHFFQDMVESDIHYLALYPDDQDSVFNEEFLHGADNILSELLPDSRRFADVVRVVDIASSSGGKLLNVDMDGDGQMALAYLTRPQ